MATKSTNAVICYFIGVWLAINLVQSAFSELHYDEAYYWVYSRFLDWGYYDHPPMVALFIKMGTLWTQAPLGARLVSVISNAIAVWVLWKIAKAYADNAKLFILLYSGMLILHVYSFITTPDTPLFFFTVLFYDVLRGYLHEDKPRYAVMLALIVAGMLYSKYHAILVILFTLMAHWKLLKRPSFWLIALLATIFFLPHIRWQVNNGYPSLVYHLLDRTSQVYRFSFISDFILGQLLIVGPLTGIFLYYYVYKQKTTDTFLRVLKFNCFGFLLFFLISAFNSRVQAHWTLLAFIPFFLLAYIYLARMPRVPSWFTRLLYANIALIFLARVLLVYPLPGLSKIKGLKQFWGKEQFARQLHAIATDEPLIMDNGFQDISYYNFTNNTTKGFSYNTRHYRKTQYDYWPIEDSIRNHGAYFASSTPIDVGKQDSMDTEKGRLYIAYIDSVRTYQKITITAKGIERQATTATLQQVTLEIYNPYSDTISFSNEGEKWDCFIEYGFTKHFFQQVAFEEISTDYRQLRIAPGESAMLSTPIRMPDSPGDYALVFSIRTDPFVGSRNSKKIPISIITN
ncbi:ArnT family glycosyltransferase [Parapedobacter koreensis]|uniref:Dolichyl-phosphate-mannose-protein mannosyltransferase n=1 Tax=Parapedobacter koreensis TaxID=332977 RepID=A0A1H7M569_9SPHI|nr:glycosyltransferase family 39 protein [Parapedobacter koreensis]SEL06363.1 Dolichyl-phosphate-mannose-protein mannosyltransferase [Parapedobacter koreensis]